MKTLEYTITKFDEENKILVVTFADGGWAQINLVAPFPASMDEIDAMVKQFAAPLEVMEARQATVDLSFIHPQVGSTRTTERLSRARSAPQAPPDTKPVTAEEVAAAEESRLREFVLSILNERGV
jgi:hypothetical protein